MTDISGPITSADQMDELIWTQVSDQFGITEPQVRYTNITSQTFDGVTYVCATQTNGDIDLWTYDTTTSGLTLMASFEGSNAANTDMTEPQLMQVGDKIAIIGNSEFNTSYAYTYDPATGAAVTDNPNNLVQESSFTTSFYGGSADDDSYLFTASNGSVYYLSQSTFGSYDGGEIKYDAAGNLIFDHMVVSASTYKDPTVGADESNVLIGESRATDYAENYNINQKSATYSVSYHQVGDTVYEYIGEEGSQGGAFHVVKWEVDPSTGELSGSQVIYTDGTTMQDLEDAGYSSQPFPAVSPFDPTALPIDDASFTKGEYLNKLAEDQGLTFKDNKAGTIDAIDFSNIRAIKTFEVNGQTYMAAGTWGGSADGIGIFSIDPATGMPDAMIDYVEGDVKSNLDGDNELFSFASSMSDFVVQELDGGDIVLSYVSNGGIMHFGFDPAEGLSTSSQSSTTGALTYVGTEGSSSNNAYTQDTFGTNFFGVASGVNGYVVLPDGKVLTGTDDAIWIANPGATDLTPVDPSSIPAPCFVAGTKIANAHGEILVEHIKKNTRIQTLDNGLKRVLWAGTRTFSKDELEADPRLYPIRIRAGALAPGYPKTDLYVSRQHRIMVRSVIAERMFDTKEVLIPAVKLTKLDGVDVVTDCDEVTYVHFLFDQHEVVFANGVEAESLFPGDEAIEGMSDEAKDEIIAIFPELANEDFFIEPVRFLPPSNLISELVSRHRTNNKPINEAGIRH